MSVREPIKQFIDKARKSNLAKDSFWSVFGNAVSMLILMICGIIIARVVGKEIYGQYGTAKNLMTSFASLAAFGFGYSSTKLISSDSFKYGGISVSAPRIISGISVAIFLVFLFFATPISNFLNKPDFKTFIVYIGILMFLKALFTVGTGIMAGYKQFKRIGLNAIYSAFLMLIICYPFTKMWGITGALIALIIYQGSAAFLALLFAYRSETVRNKYHCKDYIEILKKTLPISVHEISFTFSMIAFIMVILHYSSYGEYALYSIAAQWNAIITVIPTLLMNLTLSYLSAEQAITSHSLMLKRMLMINLLSTILPLLAVLLGANVISSIYGNDFGDLTPVLKIAVFTTLFASVALVFQSNLISEGKSWNLAAYRLGKDIFGLFILIWAFNAFSSYNCAVVAVTVDLFVHFLYALVLLVDNVMFNKRKKTA